MSAGTQLQQMAPQATIVQQVGQNNPINHHHSSSTPHLLHQQHYNNLNLQSSSTSALIGSAANPQQPPLQPQQQTNPKDQESSNMSAGSCHSDKEIETIINSVTTPEKIPRTPSDRKRKRKAPDDNGGPGGGRGVRGGIVSVDIGDRDSDRGLSSHARGDISSIKGPRLTLPIGDSKKIKDYFTSNHANSPTTIRTPGGQLPALSNAVSGSIGVVSVVNQTGSMAAKSPVPQQQNYPMYPPSPQPQLPTSVGGSNTPNAVGQAAEFFKAQRQNSVVASTSTLVPPQSVVSPSVAPPQLQQQQSRDSQSQQV